MSTNNILKGNNFAGFPCRSTFEPIHIFDNIKYDASCHRNNLWILFQDMSKAYDRVNITMLIRALGRLCIPESFIKFLISIFLPRFNQVFTAHGNTDTYLVLSGIDQGEIISPILWCIYYDPLLCFMQNSPHGYTQHINWRPDITKRTIHKFSNHVPALAYMDDTLWIADSRADLQNIMTIADSFYTLNSIQVNWDKSVLMINDLDSKPVNFKFNDKDLWLPPLHHKESTRYLGVWVSLF